MIMIISVKELLSRDPVEMMQRHRDTLQNSAARLRDGYDRRMRPALRFGLNLARIESEIDLLDAAIAAEVAKRSGKGGAGSGSTGITP